jgi:16S rRNA (cytosine967-C5)-methyltransferase
MTPGARALAAIELLDEIAAGHRPADESVAGYFRKRRYAGGGDRRAITELLFTVLRRRAQLDWWIARGGGPEPDGRQRVIAALLLRGWDDAALAAAFDGGRYRAATLSESERALVRTLAGQTLDHPDQPEALRANLPDWVVERLGAVFGSSAAGEFAALMAPAPVDLRVNTLKATRDAALASLAAAAVDAVATPLSPLGIRLAGRRPLGGLAAYRDGLIEPQDEASQIAALLTDARPGMTVVDFCAGAGGKTLALATAMENEGRIVACDVSAARLRRLAPRLARSGASIVESCVLAGMDDPRIADHAGTADRVLVDAPCSGSGAWRRDPAAKWRLGPDDLAAEVARQQEIVTAASSLVRAGGFLVYATCSLFAEEDEEQAGWFLDHHPAFTPVPIPDLWRVALGGTCPEPGPFLRLTPARHGTDGFFVAVFRCGEAA